MFGFGRKKSEIELENATLKSTAKTLETEALHAKDDANRQKEAARQLSKELREVKDQNEALTKELADLKKQTNVKLKAKVGKGAKNEFAEFEAQAKSMSDSQKMYAALTVAKKAGGRTYVAEANTVGEMRDIIKQVRQGKLVVVGK